jgi:methylmalonyl-CoA mutase N-terminal domain/subunit
LTATIHSLDLSQTKGLFMATALEKLAETYLKGAAKTHSPCGIDLKHVYRPEDTEGLDYERDLGDPGEYPFARGVYEDMYRGRLFSMRLITGCPTPTLTNDRFRLLLTEGESAINIIGDHPTMIGIDPDHPRAEGGVGLTGVPICNYHDMDVILGGLPLDQISTMLSLGTPIALPSYLCVAEDRNIPFTDLRGTTAMMGPGLYAPVCNYCGKEWIETLLLCPEAFFDTIEWVTTNVPKFHPTNYNCYNIREQGVNAAQEIAYVMAQCFEAFQVAEQCGADKELLARKMSFTANAQIDIFEEVAKFRAARRIFANTLRERFKIQNPKSLRMKVHVNTGGSLMEHPQAKINVIRGAYAALAAVLGGVQSLQIASYDEPIAIPTDEAATMALRTEQILAHETGIGNVVDPLAGSYYVETLTNKVQEEIQRIIDEIESLGGMTHVVRTGWLDQQMEREFLRRQQELETKERIVVGVNDYIVPSEEDDMVPNYEIDTDAVNAYVSEIREFKENRDIQPLHQSLEALRNVLEEGKKTPIPYIMKALRARATTGEVTGMYRMAKGYSYDPWDEVACPF